MSWSVLGFVEQRFEERWWFAGEMERFALGDGESYALMVEEAEREGDTYCPPYMPSPLIFAASRAFALTLYMPAEEAPLTARRGSPADLSAELRAHFDGCGYSDAWCSWLLVCEIEALREALESRAAVMWPLLEAMEALRALGSPDEVRVVFAVDY